MISLDCHSSSPLDFKEARQRALAAIAKGKKIQWHLDFGFFDRLLFPLSDAMQAQAHRLAIQHFVSNLWPEFSSYTDVVSLYRGPLYPPIDFNQLASYINLLADYFQEELPLFIFFSEEFPLPLETALRATPEDWGRFSLFLNDKPLPHRRVDEPIAILIPEKKLITKEIIAMLQKKTQSLPSPRFVYEAFLTSEWEGVNELYVVQEALQETTKRKLAGFLAAEGTVHIIS